MSCHVTDDFVNKFCANGSAYITGIHESADLNFLVDLKPTPIGTVEIVHNSTKYVQLGMPKKLGDGGYGTVYKIELANVSNADDTIAIAYKESKDGSKLDEIRVLKKYPSIFDSICPYIIPTKLIGNKAYMPLGDGDLSTLSKMTVDGQKISLSAADQIISCIQNTLLCLQKHGIYYFDLKPENIIFKCNNSILLVWLADIGSVLPDDENEYVCSLPHPLSNSPTPEFVDASIYENMDNLLSYYAYLLTMIFCSLVFNVDPPDHTTSKTNKIKLLEKMHKLCKKNSECIEKYPKYFHVLDKIIYCYENSTEDPLCKQESLHTDFWLFDTNKKPITSSLLASQLLDVPPTDSPRKILKNKVKKNPFPIALPIKKKKPKKVGVKMYQPKYELQSDPRKTKSA